MTAVWLVPLGIAAVAVVPLAVAASRLAGRVELLRRRAQAYRTDRAVALALQADATNEGGDPAEGGRTRSS
jgi:hypothetical protein